MRSFVISGMCSFHIIFDWMNEYEGSLMDVFV
jgi:hypothetical protein